VLHQPSRISQACLLVFLTTGVTAAPPGDYERGVSEKLAEAQEPGKAIWLSAGPDEFLALFESSEIPGPGRAALILHGLGGHADWPDVIAPLRTGLPARGWATLSMQLPVVEPGESWAAHARTVAPVRARVDAALAFLEQRDFQVIAMIGYGFGGALSAQYLAARRPAVDGFVGISLYAPPYLQDAVDLFASLERIGVPVMDVFGGRDIEDVRMQADDRRFALRKNRGRRYRQSIVEGADHLFSDFSVVLVDRIAGWLDTAVSPTGEDAEAGTAPPIAEP